MSTRVTVTSRFSQDGFPEPKKLCVRDPFPADLKCNVGIGFFSLSAHIQCCRSPSPGTGNKHLISPAPIIFA